MKLFVVAVPLFNSDVKVKAYHLICQNGDRPLGLSFDHTFFANASESHSVGILNQVGTEPFSAGFPIFVDFNNYQLMTEAPLSCNIQKSKMVCVLNNDVAPVEPYLGKINALIGAGCKIAFSRLAFTEQNYPLLLLADYMVVDTTAENFLREVVKIRQYMPKMKLLLTNIDSKSAFDLIKKVPNALFEGHFYSLPLTKGTHEITSLKSNAMQLLRLVNEDDFDLDAASAIIKRDPSITVDLFRFINSPAVGLTHTVTSINAAVSLLGQKEFKKWIAVTVSVQLALDKPNEIIRLSLIRAKFCENIAIAFGLGQQAPALFLTGMFSLLDIIMGMPMAAALRQMNVPEEIVNALLYKTGKFAQVLEFVNSYEFADWQSVTITMIRRNIDIEYLYSAFMDALIWYKELVSGKTEMATEA